MKGDFRDNLKSNINIENQNNINNSDINTTEVETQDTQETTAKRVFKLSKKVDDKTNKKSFPVYMENDLLKRLDKLCTKSNYSRNELINIMIEDCLNNLEFED